MKAIESEIIIERECVSEWISECHGAYNVRLPTAQAQKRIQEYTMILY